MAEAAFLGSSGGEGRCMPRENSSSQGATESSLQNLLDHAGFLLINTTVTLGGFSKCVCCPAVSNDFWLWDFSIVRVLPVGYIPLALGYCLSSFLLLWELALFSGAVPDGTQLRNGRWTLCGLSSHGFKLITSSAIYITAVVNVGQPSSCPSWRRLHGFQEEHSEPKFVNCNISNCQLSPALSHIGAWIGNWKGSLEAS